MDLRVRSGDKGPEPSVEESGVDEAKESMKLEVLSQTYFDHVHRGVVHIEDFLQIQTIDQNVHKKILRHLYRSAREKR